MSVRPSRDTHGNAPLSNQLTVPTKYDVLMLFPLHRAFSVTERKLRRADAYRKHVRRPRVTVSVASSDFELYAYSYTMGVGLSLFCRKLVSKFDLAM